MAAIARLRAEIVIWRKTIAGIALEMMTRAAQHTGPSPLTAHRERTWRGPALRRYSTEATMTLQQKIRNSVRTLLKYTLNPLTRRLARTSHGPVAIVRHVGRRSGRQYETPIIVGPADNGFVI